MHEDVKWFLGIILVIGILWIGGSKTGGLFSSKKVATSTPAAKTKIEGQPTGGAQTQTNTQGRPQGVIFSAPNTVGSGISGGASGAQGGPQIPPNASPLYGKLIIQSVNRGYDDNPANEYVAVSAPSSNTEAISLAGVSLASGASRTGIPIPTAWRLPFLNTPGSGETVVLKPGEVAYIITGRSANGMSFQINRCTGFFEQNLNFSPSLPMECPSPLEEPLPPPPNQLSDACYDYLASFPRCSVQTGAFPAYLQSDGGCQAQVAKISYGNCVDLHKNKPGFYRGDWRIYLSRDSSLWRARREIVQLLDSSGRIIHSYSY